MKAKITGWFEVDEERNVARLILEWPFLPTMQYLPTELKIKKWEDTMEDRHGEVIKERQERRVRKEWFQKHWNLRPRTANIAALTTPEELLAMNEEELDAFLTRPGVGPATANEIREVLKHIRE